MRYSFLGIEKVSFPVYPGFSLMDCSMLSENAIIALLASDKIARGHWSARLSRRQAISEATAISIVKEFCLDGYIGLRWLDNFAWKCWRTCRFPRKQL